ncbi:hypothetical protein Tco_0641526, partial [Tanacetum coccineum]
QERLRKKKSTLQPWKQLKLCQWFFSEVNAELAKSVIEKDMSEEDFAKRMKRTAKKQKIDDKDAQSTKEKVDEEKEKEPVKKMGKRRKQIARKGLHTDKTTKGEAEKDEASEKDNPSSGTNVPINPVPV